MLPLLLLEKPYYLMLSHDFVARQPALAGRIWQTIAEVRDGAAYRKRERALGVVANHVSGSAYVGKRP